MAAVEQWDGRQIEHGQEDVDEDEVQRIGRQDRRLPPLCAPPESMIVAVSKAVPKSASRRFIPGPASATKTISRRGLRRRA